MAKKGHITLCPNCGSEHTSLRVVLDSTFLYCNHCGYDEADDVLDVYPETRNTQSSKGNFSPYKKGGSQRTKK